MKCALYVRISTQDQNCELQLRALREYAERCGWPITGTYQDVIGGAKARRPELDRLMADARTGMFDCVLVWKLDRFGRSLRDCLNNLEALKSAKVRFIAITQGIDTDEQNPTSRFQIQLLGAAAEFERSLILERTQAGRVRYLEDFDAGKVGRTVHSRSGRDLPAHRPRKIFDRLKVVELYEQYGSLRRVAREMRLGIGTVQRVVKECSKSRRSEKDGHPMQE
ncbi:MAG TPA: recombinase family protein [Terriglobia bacterium]|nr:recombinase family protein [Terriglobia bacterium]